MLQKYFAFAFLLVFTLLLAPRLRAQEELGALSPFAHGAGGTYAITSRGLNAVGLNPSLLGLGTPRPIEISLAPISSLGISAGPSLSQINSISGGFDSIASVQVSNTPDSVSRGDSIRESIANLLANNGLSSTIDMRIFGISYYDPNLGGFALTWTMHGIIQASVPSALLNYMGVGALARLGQDNPLAPQSLNLQALWYSEYTLSYGRTLLGEPASGDLQLLGGVGLKYVSGVAVMQMNPGEFDVNDFTRYPNLDLTEIEHYLVGVNYQIRSAYPTEFNFTNLPSTISTKLIANASAGNGYGADLGFTLGAFDSSQRAPWQVALSVSDLGSIQWNSNVSIRIADTVLNPATAQSNKDTLNAQLKALGGRDSAASSFSTPLPTTLHIAAALDLSEIGLALPGIALGLVSEYSVGLTNTVGAPVNGQFGIAATLEHPSDALSLEAALGMTMQDGITNITAAFGLGIANRILFDVGTGSLNGLFTKAGSTDAAFGLKILF